MCTILCQFHQRNARRKKGEWTLNKCLCIESCFVCLFVCWFFVSHDSPYSVVSNRAFCFQTLNYVRVKFIQWKQTYSFSIWPRIEASLITISFKLFFLFFLWLGYLSPTMNSARLWFTFRYWIYSSHSIVRWSLAHKMEARENSVHFFFIPNGRMAFYWIVFEKRRTNIS